MLKISLENKQKLCLQHTKKHENKSYDNNLKKVQIN